MEDCVADHHADNDERIGAMDLPVNLSRKTALGATTT